MAYQYQYGTQQQGYQPQMNYQQNGMNYQQPQQQPQMQQPQVQNTGILYVDGDKGAEEFPMFPNTFAFLKSTDGKSVYFKQALANGTVTCDKFAWCEMNAPQTNDYVTREEFNNFIQSLKESVNNDEQQSTTKSTKSSSKNTRVQKADGE